MAVREPTERSVKAEVAERFLRFQDAQQTLHKIRGEYLHSMIQIEELIDGVIIAYFKPDEASQFIEWMVSRVSFSGKLEVLRRILQEVDLWTTYKDLWRRIDQLRSERNRFAHSGLSFIENSFLDPEGEFTLTRHHSAKQTRPDPNTTIGVRSLEALVNNAQSALVEFLPVEADVLARHGELAEVFWRPGLE